MNYILSLWLILFLDQHWRLKSSFQSVLKGFLTKDLLNWMKINLTVVKHERWLKPKTIWLLKQRLICNPRHGIIYREYFQIGFTNLVESLNCCWLLKHRRDETRSIILVLQILHHNFRKHQLVLSTVNTIKYGRWRGIFTVWLRPFLMLTNLVRLILFGWRI